MKYCRAYETVLCFVFGRIEVSLSYFFICRQRIKIL